MNIVEQLKSTISGEILLNEPMKNHTSLKVGGPADIFIVPENRKELLEILRYLKSSNLSYFILGGGTNLLISDDGIEAAVIDIKKALKDLELRKSGDKMYVWTESGVRIMQLLMFLQESSMHGLEFLHGIPGTVGGAVIMNAGTHYGYVSGVCESVEILDNELNLWEIAGNSLNFDYRTSGIEEGTVILSALLTIQEGANLKSIEIRNELEQKRKTSHPVGLPSAGCFFKNPSPSMPAGRLIDKAGLKGLRIGNAEVSTVHANFLLNRGDAKAKDFIELINTIKKTVMEKFNISLELEVKVIGRNVNKS